MRANLLGGLRRQGTGLYKQGQYAEAAQCFEQSCELLRTSEGFDLELSFCLVWLAEAFKSMGSKNKAEPLYQQCQEIQLKKVGKEHPEYATTLGNLAGLYQENGFPR